MKKKNYEPAFPLPDSYNEAGMSIRDYFAAKAMQALMANETFTNNLAMAEELPYYETIAHHSYNCADAMLKEREK